jgi:hypothetical protein
MAAVFRIYDRLKQEHVVDFQDIMLGGTIGDVDQPP